MIFPEFKNANILAHFVMFLERFEGVNERPGTCRNFAERSREC
jgi:hypothetical protein